jgi:hypothetical protein
MWSAGRPKRGGRTEREKKLAAKRAAAADEQGRLVSMSMG